MHSTEDGQHTRLGLSSSIRNRCSTYHSTLKVDLPKFDGSPVELEKLQGLIRAMHKRKTSGRLREDQCSPSSNDNRNSQICSWRMVVQELKLLYD